MVGTDREQPVAAGQRLRVAAEARQRIAAIVESADMAGNARQNLRKRRSPPRSPELRQHVAAVEQRVNQLGAVAGKHVVVGGKQFIETPQSRQQYRTVVEQIEIVRIDRENSLACGEGLSRAAEGEKHRCENRQGLRRFWSRSSPPY